MQISLSLVDLGILIGIFSAAQGVIYAVLQSKFLPRSYLFRPPTGTPIYKTIEECKEMEEKRNKERQERDKRIWNSIGTMEEAHNKFLKDLPKLFQAQTEQLVKVLERTT